MPGFFLRCFRCQTHHHPQNLVDFLGQVVSAVLLVSDYSSFLLKIRSECSFLLLLFVTFSHERFEILLLVRHIPL